MIKVINLFQDPLLDEQIDNKVNNDEKMAIVVLVSILNAELEKNRMDCVIILEQKIDRMDPTHNTTTGM